MEQLYNGFQLHIPAGVFPLSTDSMLLADFAKLPKDAFVVDLGSGCGTLGMLLCAKDPGCQVVGLEIDPVAHEAALSNAADNAISHRLTSICTDLRYISQHLSVGSADCCISNPPYFSGGPVSLSVPNARRMDLCVTKELFSSAAWVLRYGGDFFIVHRPEQLAELCACASAAGLEPKRLRLVRHAPSKPVSLILLQCRKGGKPGLTWEELILHNEDGTLTDACRKIYHL